MRFSDFLQSTFRVALGLVIGAAVINILFDPVMGTAPNYFSAQTLSYVYGVSLITFLIGLANNPFFAAVADAIALLFTIVGEGMLSNLFSSPQTYAQTLFIVSYITYIYLNAIFFFIHWIPLMVQGSIIAPVVLVFVDVLTSVFSISTILYILVALGRIPPDV